MAKRKNDAPVEDPVTDVQLPDDPEAIGNDAAPGLVPAGATFDAKGVAEIIRALRGDGGLKGYDPDTLGEVIGKAVAQGINSTNRRKVTAGEYRLRGHSPFHPKPQKDTPVLRRQTWQNGVWCNPTTLTDDEIALLNQITHSGRYIGDEGTRRLVEVIVRTDGSEEAVEIRFNVSTPDSQLELKGYVRNFADMLRQIVAEQKLEDAEAAEQEAAIRETRARIRARTSASA